MTPSHACRRKRALAKEALPSARSMILPSVPADLPQASMTKGSLTDVQAMVSMPLFLNSSTFSMKPGRCLVLHVGVKAPGTPIRMTYKPRHYVSA